MASGGACLGDAEIAAMLDGRLADDDARRAREHLVGCAMCRRLISDAIPKIPDAQRRAALQDTIQTSPAARARAKTEEQRRPARRWWIAAAGGAGVVLAVVLVRGLLSDRSSEPCDERAACVDLGRRLEADRDMRGALAAFTRGCELDSGDACYAAATFWNDLKKLDNQDASRANTLFEKGCMYGSIDACGEFANNLVDGRGCAADPRRAAQLVAGPCALGHARACRMLAGAFHEGEGVPRDESLRHLLNTRACELGDAAACSWEGAFLVMSNDPATHRRAVEYLQRGCEAEPVHCYNYALATATGHGLDRDPPKARGLYQRACAAGSPTACNNLGTMLREGQGGARDLGAARELFHRACSSGVLVACGNVKKLDGDLRGK